MKAYPQPRLDADNADFLDAWRAGRLQIQHCRACRHSFFYPRPCCPSCWSDQVEAVASAGRGTIVSYSLVRRPNDPAFNDEVPIILAEVELAEGARLLARIVNTSPKRVRSALAVATPPVEIAMRFPLPVFVPAET